jgi:aminotransferase/cystathionine beta-lyase
MKYDFETPIARRDWGSIKWNNMYRLNPDITEAAVPLTTADMEFRNAPEIIDGLIRFLERMPLLGYTEPTEDYFASVMDWMSRRHRYHVSKEWIVPTAGVIPALFVAVRAFTEKNDGILIMPPVYRPFFSAVKYSGRVIAENPLIYDNGHYHINFDQLEELAGKPQNKMLLFCSPHNPAGRVWTKDELERVADICLRNDLLLVSDEIHHDLIMNGYYHEVFPTISDEIADRCIVCTAPSKTFNLAGLCTSNIIIANRELRNRFKREIASTKPDMINILGYEACRLAYSGGEAWLEELLAVINENQIMTNTCFSERFPRIKAPLIEGTYLQWLDFRALGMDPVRLQDFLIYKAEVVMEDGSIFGKEGAGYERLNLAAPKRVLREHLDRLITKLEEECSGQGRELCI